MGKLAAARGLGYVTGVAVDPVAAHRSLLDATVARRRRLAR